MPRKPRIEFEGAIYQVINRGNYRLDIFESPKTAKAFEACVFEAAQRAQWLLHAYCVMRNHFHLEVETPRGNLAAGMHWLQSTFATRFNRRRGERGHLFQGRYYAGLIEPGFPVACVANYIHLNPVRAGIVTVDQLAEYRLSSFPRFQQRKRPDFLVCDDWLEALGGLQDTPAGWRSYHDYLRWLAADAGEQKRQGFDRMCRGWALGSKPWRQEVAKSQVERLGKLYLRGEQIDELKEAVWTRALDDLLAKAGRTRADAAAFPCGAEWKVGLAEQVRLSTTATNAWIARELSLGSPTTLSANLSRWRRRT